MEKKVLENQIRDLENSIIETSDNLFTEIGLEGVINHLQELMSAYFNPGDPDAELDKEQTSQMVYHNAVITMRLSQLYEMHSNIKQLKSMLSQPVLESSQN